MTTSKPKKRIGRPPKYATRGKMLSVRLDEGLIERIKRQPDPRAFIEQALRQALDGPTKIIERVPHEEAWLD